MTRNGRHGFTIIELLIIIVLVAILASITVVSYGGIQGRAEKVRTESVVKTYMKALEMHYSEFGRYPVVAYSYAAICLGTLEDYPAADGFAAGQCRKNATDLTLFGSADNELNSRISRYGSTLRSNVPLQPKTLWWGGGNLSQRGIAFSNLDPTWYSIVYLLPGNQTCTNMGSGIVTQYMASQNTTGCAVTVWH